MDQNRTAWSTPTATPEVDDGGGLEALTRFARMAAGADLAVAFEAVNGVALPLASDPGPLPQAFRFDAERIAAIDWSGGPRSADGLRLPSALTASLGRPADSVLFFAAPSAEAPGSGVLMLFAANAGRRCICPFRSEVEGSVSLLAAAFAQVMAARRSLRHRRLMGERFHDLFESVAAGVVLVEGDGSMALVNEHAAALLGSAAGEVTVSEVARHMRALRESADNIEALMAVYGPLQADVDYAVTTIWELGERRVEVDTHPVLGDGRNGRIWLFRDVTAEVRQTETLRTMAETDPLTSLANRRRFEASAAAAIARARAEGASLAVLMLDIDHFKSVNDRWGHAVGDAVLRAVAGRCRAVLKATDLIARLGGEEFVVLMPDVSAEDATAAAERLRATVAASPVVADGSAVDVRISLGVTLLRESDAALDPLLERADGALYTAKRTGRDRVVFTG
jgi:diguanylate cyclase (GGDEF)-like protein